MKKYLKKIASLLLALMMVMGMTTTAFAAETTKTGSITIKEASVGQTYTLYRIFNLESYSGQKYAYTVNSKWKGFANSSTASKYITVDDGGYVTWKDGAKAEDFAEAALEYATATATHIDYDKQEKASSEKEDARTTTLTFSSLPLGYYLIDSTAGTVCALDTTAKDVTITAKNPQPTVEKKVKEDSTGDFGKENTADIGQTVEFETTINAQPGAENYILHDKMTEGLTFTGVTEIKMGENPVDASNYEVITGDERTHNDCSFEIKFKKEFLDSIKAAVNSVMQVRYTAVLNENAVVAGAGNINETWLSFGEKSDMNTTHEKTTTYTWSIPIFKYYEQDGQQKPLQGAQFSLSKIVNGKTTKVINFIDNKNGTYRVAKDDESNNANCTNHLVSGADGNITVTGLDAEVYYLTEVVAPDGFNKLTSPIMVIVNEDGSIKQDAINVEKVSVLNGHGIVLPHTGGMGTTILYVLGTVLVLGAAILLVARKRMNSDK